MTHSAPLVGMHFRPPAKALLAALPANHPLELVPEPENPYDPNAIAVYLRSSTVSQQALGELSETLPPMGCDVETFIAQPLWHIGYMAKEHAALHHLPLADIQARELASYGECSPFIANLSFSPEGKYVIKFNL